MEDKKVAEMKMEIADYLRKKDYYDLLGVPKTAEEPQIKKAFKRLALRFHPDKNAVEGSKDVFKKLANAYSTLTDADKRAHYDRFGPDEQIQQAQAQAYAYQAQQEHDFDFQRPEDIFMHVLFGGQRPQQFRHRRYQQQEYHQEAQGRPQTNINVLYIIGFLVVMSIITSLFETKPYHSMAKTDVYRYQIFTDVLKVPFFVREEYFPASKELNFKRKIFEAVDISFISQLKQSCDQASRTKKSFEYKASTYRSGPTKDSYLFKASQVDQSSCSNLIQINARHQNYINRLFYYY